MISSKALHMMYYPMKTKEVNTTSLVILPLVSNLKVVVDFTMIHLIFLIPFSEETQVQVVDRVLIVVSLQGKVTEETPETRLGLI